MDLQPPEPPYAPDGYPAEPLLRKKRRRGVRVLVLCFMLGLAAIPLGVGATLYLALGGVFTPIGDPLGVHAVAGAPRLQDSTVAVPEWSSTSRVNVLLLGVDQRDGDTAPPRTDTIIVATFDPQTKSAGLLSLPRDLYVPIPGYGTDRINAAFELGEAERKGGGPELTRKTAEQLLGVPIQHYAVIGFHGFEKLVDQVGGVVVDVERPIKDNEYPDGDYGLRRIFFQPGLQRLDGESALWYVRTRHADSDFGRARRQQQFLIGLRHQALQLNLLPKAPAMLGTLSDAIKTDLRPTEIIALANSARGVDTGHITNRVIDETMTNHYVTPAGAQVEIPDKAAVKRVVQDVFGSGK